ncbi:MAG: ORF6N domain-containing protein [Bryobacteraceae bacterium]|nr:ORF6N domain-containing protein [Bryobacteraceae bacterium]
MRKRLSFFPAMPLALTTNAGRGARRSAPYAFTEQGVAMLSSVLNGHRAVQVNLGERERGTLAFRACCQYRRPRHGRVLES